MLTCSADIFKKLIRFFSFKECKIISNDSSFMLIELIRAARWKSLFKRSSWSERFTTKTEIDIVILSMLIETASHTSKKRARSSVTFIIIMLIFWRTDSWAISINHLNMQLTSASLSNIALILIFSIITFIIEQTTMYMRRKNITRITIFFKCTDFVELNLIESMCTFFSFMSFDCAIILFSFNIVFISLSIMLRNICLNNSKEISSNLQRRISINVFNICLIISTESNCSLMICVNFWVFLWFQRFRLNWIWLILSFYIWQLVNLN